jgi:hypothetical protein
MQLNHAARRPRQNWSATCTGWDTSNADLRGSAVGFRNLTSYIARSLFETGGFG